jgi:hypothetical protein
MFVIKSDDGYWSNEFGWVDTIECATQFSADERKVLNLPIGHNVGWIEVTP